MPEVTQEMEATIEAANWIIESLKAENQRLRRLLDEEEQNGPFVASKNRPHFHRPNCEWAGYIPSYNTIEYSSHAEAVEAGKKPCKTCRA